MDATRTLRREDGAAVGAPATKTCRVGAGYKHSYAPAPYPTMTAAAKNKCLVDWGWK